MTSAVCCIRMVSYLWLYNNKKARSYLKTNQSVTPGVLGWFGKNRQDRPRLARLRRRKKTVSQHEASWIQEKRGGPTSSKIKVGSDLPCKIVLWKSGGINVPVSSKWRATLTPDKARGPIAKCCHRFSHHRTISTTKKRSEPSWN